MRISLEQKIENLSLLQRDCDTGPVKYMDDPIIENLSLLQRDCDQPIRVYLLHYQLKTCPCFKGIATQVLALVSVWAVIENLSLPQRDCDGGLRRG